jgi:hypothetical protein
VVDFSNALDAVLAAFGETVTYTPYGGTAASITAVWGDVYSDVDAATGAVMQSDQPNILIKESDLAAGVAQEGDTVTRSAVTYKVIKREIDGQGGAKLLLHEAA